MDYFEERLRKNKKTYTIFLFIFGPGLLITLNYVLNNGFSNEYILFEGAAILLFGVLTLLSIYQIFSLSGQISELEKAAEEKAAKIAQLCKIHGEKFGEAIYDGKFMEGMKEPAVLESRGKPNLNEDKVFSYSNSNRSITKVSFKSGKVSEIEDIEPFQLEMSKSDVISLWGESADSKETVLKSKTKSRWFYFPRNTRQRTTVYGYHVDFEDDFVTGFKEL